MRIGNLRHKIEFITMSEIQDDIGAISEAETSLAFTMASVTPLNGGEKFMANQLYTEATAQIRCRYIPQINTKCKIKFGTRNFNILNVQNKDERNMELWIVAKEIL